MTPRAQAALAQSRGEPVFAPLPISGALQGVDPGLVDRAATAWAYVVPGGRIEVSTGVSDHSPTNHAPGHAIDFRVMRPDGSVVRWNDPEAMAAARIGASLGVHGIGGGDEYMGGTHFHWDVSANGPRTWSDSGANQSPIGFGQGEYASLIAASRGVPVESVLAELGITPGQIPTFAPVAGGNPLSGPNTGGNPLAGPPNALATLQPGQEQQEQGQQNRLLTNQFALDPQDFMSRRRFQIIPHGVT